jgi:hypothetical protein
VWETVDPDGRRIVLPLDAWLHIVEAHSDLTLDQHQILLIVEAPRLWADRAPEPAAVSIVSVRATSVLGRVLSGRARQPE